eukprot:gene3925-4294_t
MAVHASMLLLGVVAATGPGCRLIRPSECTGSVNASGCGKVIAAALAACSEQGGGTVRLAAGVFHLGSLAPRHAWATTPAGNDVRHYVTIDGSVNVSLAGTLAADGETIATFVVLSGITNFINILNTRGFTLANLVLDMDRPNWSYGRLEGCPAGVGGCDFAVNVTEYPFASFLDPVPPALLQVTQMESFDPVTWRVGPDDATTQVYTPGANITRVAAPSAGVSTVSVRGITPSTVQQLSQTTGQYYVLRHRNGHLGRELGRGDHQVAGLNNSDMLQENITSYLAPSMFNVVGSTQQTLRNIHLRRHDGATGAAWNSSSWGIRRPKSAQVDCLGTPDARGHVLIEGCSCDGQGDDGYNGGFTYNQILHISPDRRSAHLSWARDPVHPPVANSTGFYPGAGGLVPGDQVVFHNRSSFTQLASATVTGVVGSGTVANFDSPLPPAVSVYDLVGPAPGRLYSLTIRRSSFSNNRARGLLLFTSDVLVEDTVIDSPSMECVMVEPDGCTWLEGAAATNVTLRNVTMRGCAHAHYGNPEPVEHTASVFLGECVPDWDQQGRPETRGQPYTGGGPKVFTNWTVEGCHFQQPDGRAVLHAISLDGMRFANNTIIGGPKQPFVLVSSDRCDFESNSCSGGDCPAVENGCTTALWR